MSIGRYRCRGPNAQGEAVAQTLSDLCALIPAGADPEALRAAEGALYDPAPIAPERLVPILAHPLAEGQAQPASGPVDGLAWDVHAAAIRALSDGPRAILCAGFKARIEAGAATRDEVGASPDDCISAPDAALAAALLPVARDLAPQDLAVIAQAAGAARAATEREIGEALRTGRLKAAWSDGWDCVDATASEPSARGWAACLAWTVLRALAECDECRLVADRWRWGHAALLSLPPASRAPLLAGLRGVMERETARPGGMGFDAGPPIPYEGPLF
ncbi:hypothetical protein ACQ5SO_20680 [Rhodovulum sp. DZ06]|uniref:hypothetical protein n=1 Tax=Rhodovulum sp. DZ06 TaxID=3425126 RepID=UPI003D343816